MGCFPGFFSHNASQGHYFTRPELYDRDRPLFKKYVPLCKLVAEAGWRPDHRGPVERRASLCGAVRRALVTVFNDSPEHAHRDDSARRPGAGVQPRTGFRPDD